MRNTRAGKVPGQGRIHESSHVFRRHVGGHRNHALGPQRHHRQRQGIIPGEHGEIIAALVNDVGDLPQRPAAFLDPHHVFEFGETRNCGRGHVHAGTPRYVVEDQWQIHGLGHGRIVLIQPFLCGLVVIGRDEERAVRAGLFGVGGKGDRLVRGVRAGTGNHRNPPVDDLHGKRHDVLVLFV